MNDIVDLAWKKIRAEELKQNLDDLEAKRRAPNYDPQATRNFMESLFEPEWRKELDDITAEINEKEGRGRQQAGMSGNVYAPVSVSQEPLTEGYGASQSASSSVGRFMQNFSDGVTNHVKGEFDRSGFFSNPLSDPSAPGRAVGAGMMSAMDPRGQNLGAFAEGWSDFDANDYWDVAKTSVLGAEAVLNGATAGMYGKVNDALGGNYSQRKQKFIDETGGAGKFVMNGLEGTAQGITRMRK